MNTRIGDVLHGEAVDVFNRDPTLRFDYAMAVTTKHCPGDLAADVRERFDEPFEQQHVCWELNTIQGPWVEHSSDGMFRWLPVRTTDLDAVETGNDFLRLMYLHVVPA